jgi:hypothetical protein
VSGRCSRWRAATRSAPASARPASTSSPPAPQGRGTGCQVRRWTSWHRWTILAMLAYAFVAVLAATERAETSPSPRLIALTCNEIRHLFNTLIGEPIREALARAHGDLRAAISRSTSTPTHQE